MRWVLKIILFPISLVNFDCISGIPAWHRDGVTIML